MPRRLFHFPRRAFRAAVGLALACSVVALALTHTRVGRDALRVQLEAWFARQFAGQLQIGALEGNLVNTLFATRVRLVDPDGREVAVVDSLVVRPSWLDLLDRSFTVRRLEVYRPTLRLVRDEAGVWNLRRALERRKPPADSLEERAPWEFVSTDVVVMGGRVETRNRGERPEPVERGHVFDYTNASFSDLDVRATLDLKPGYKLVDLTRFTGLAVEPGRAVEAHGQLLIRDQYLSLGAFRMLLGQSELAFDGSVENLEPFSRLGLQELARARLDLDILPSRLLADDIRPFFPALPLHDQIELSGSLSGPLSQLAVERLALSRASSYIHLTGAIAGLPDSVSCRLRVEDSRLVPADMEAFAPESDLSLADAAGTIELSGDLRALVRLSHASEGGRWGASADLTFLSGLGGGTVSLSARGLADAQTRFEGELQARGLNVSPWLSGRLPRSELNGRILASGETGPASRQWLLAVDLGPSVLAGRRVDLLDADLEAHQTTVSGSILAYEDDAWLRLDGDVDLDTLATAFRLTASSDNLDLADLTGDEELASRIDGSLRLSGSGRDLRSLELEGHLETTRSSFGRDTDQLNEVASSSEFFLRRPTGDRTEFRITGDLLNASLSGRFDPAALIASATYWREAVSRTVEAQAAMPFRRREVRTVASTFDADAARDQRRAALQAAGYEEGLEMTGRLALLRPELVHALRPRAPALLGQSEVRFEARLDAEQAVVSAQFKIDSLAGGFLSAGRLQGAVALETNYERTLEATSTGSMKLAADRLRVGAQATTEFDLSAEYGGRRCQFVARSLPVGGGSFQTEAALYLLSDRNRFTINRFVLETSEHLWRNSKIASIDLYDGATVVRNLAFENRPELARRDPSRAQRIVAEGVLSSSPGDTLFVTATQIRLDQISDLLGTRRKFAGDLSTRLAISGTEGSRQAVGDLVIQDLSIDDHNVGTLSLASRYAPSEAEGVLIDGRVRQLRPEAPRVEPNSVDIAGWIRPGSGSTELDLDVTLHRVDFWFFDLIFDAVDQTTGYASGKGHVGGTLRTPVFDGEFRGHDVVLTVPEYNLRYTLGGDFSIDQTGIHLRDIGLVDPTGGTATATGSLYFNAYRYFSFDLDFKTQALQIMNVESFSPDLPFYGLIWTTGTFTLDGPVYEASLRSTDATTRVDSELFMPVTEVLDESDTGFIIMADSTGRFPNVESYLRRRNLVARRAAGERTFLDGLEMNLNFDAPEGSTVHLVFDPLLGDVVNAVGNGRIQLLRREGEYFTYGEFSVSSGDYLFTAAEVFVRRFVLEPGGTITWDGDPIDGALEIPATYRTRASLAGLPGFDADRYETLPFLIRMDITGRVTAPLVDLHIALDRDQRVNPGAEEGIETLLNRPDLTAEYATSVLLTNTFLLTTSQAGSIGQAADELLFNSLSQLVASQLNRFISGVVSNLDVNVGLQQGRSIEQMDVTYGFALRLLDQRLVIRGEGVYRGDPAVRNNEGINGELAVEIRLNPSVILEVFYRREGDPLNVATSLGSAYGAGLVYQTDFASWPAFVDRLRGAQRAPTPRPPLPDSTAAAVGSLND